MSATLTDWQIEIDDLVLGYGLAYRLFGFDHEKPEVRGDALDMPNEDGIVFPRQYMGGTVLTFDFGLYTTDAANALAMLARMRRAWQADTARLQTRTVVPLRYKLPGQATRCVFGRPGKFTPASQSTTEAGYIPVTCDFQCVDHRFYSDVEHAVTVSLIPDRTGGITWPVTWPVVWIDEGSRGDIANNAGDTPTWPVFTFTGPVARPGVRLPSGNSLAINTTILAGSTVTVDTRPWVRTTLDASGGSMAGLLLGNRLAEMSLGTGVNTVGFTGTDLTGNARLGIAWRDAWTSL